MINQDSQKRGSAMAQLALLVTPALTSGCGSGRGL